MKIIIRALILGSLFAGVAGCASMGHEFQFQGPDTIVVGKTTKKDIVDRYGNPFRVGFENGKVKWTYGYYKYRLIGDSDTKDLTITFEKSGVVSAYQYSSSMEDDVKKYNPQAGKASGKTSENLED